MKIHKKIKTFILIIIVYLIASFLTNLILLINITNNKYKSETHSYARSKLCYECAIGVFFEVCPAIYRRQDRSGNFGKNGFISGINAVYPNAKEFTEYKPKEFAPHEVSKIKIKDINNEFIINHDYCYLKDWTDEARYISYYNKLKPTRFSLFVDVAKEDMTLNRVIFGPFFIIFCIFGGCKM